METHEVHKNKRQRQTDRPPYVSSCRQVCGRSGTMTKNSKTVPNMSALKQLVRDCEGFHLTHPYKMLSNNVTGEGVLQLKGFLSVRLEVLTVV